MNLLKRRISIAVLAFALALAVTGSGTVIADAVGLSLTPQAAACGDVTGGNC